MSDVELVYGLGIRVEDYEEEIQYKLLELTGEVCEDDIIYCWEEVIRILNIKCLKVRATNECDEEKGYVLINWKPRNYMSKMSHEKEIEVLESFSKIGIELKVEDLWYVNSCYIYE